MGTGRSSIPPILPITHFGAEDLCKSGSVAWDSLSVPNGVAGEVL